MKNQDRRFIPRGQAQGSDAARVISREPPTLPASHQPSPTDGTSEKQPAGGAVREVDSIKLLQTNLS
ncbi:hypothetical protein E2C01_039804 [Portunus trituberculatus]|uniref:Uncharacterized protein n=1 Tax=Portunus trituberculatus TaxID=210409 RepID=A0A5B7FKZ2_PORTR|nr:hypothetical protein [Portunus trituberculatus]